MEPASIVSLIAGTATAIQFLVQVASKIEENKTECQRLGAHAQDVLEIVRRSSESKELPRRAVERLTRLENKVNKLGEELESLSKAPKLKRMLWASNGRESISAIYRTLDDLIKVCTLECQFDVERMVAEREKARLQDEQIAKSMFEKCLSNDQQIISLLDTRLPEMADAIQAIQKKLLHMDDSVQRTVLEKGMRAMQRTTGPLPSNHDDFNISSLEVIIHEHRKLGEGGFGQVYHATWLGTAVAVKVTERGVPAKVFEKEVALWRRLRHPHVLQFYGVCLSGPQPFAVCALKTRGNAVEYLENHPTACRYKLLHEASLGLVYLHNHNVIHGDLKAPNILIDGNGTACLSDFGLSRLKLRTSTMRPDKKVESGTLRWMSPEQMLEGVLNFMCDSYSFGMTMYEIFSGQPPFGHSPENLIYTLVVERDKRPPRPSLGPDGDEDVDDETWSLMQDLWHQNPKSRPRATQLACRLESLVSQQPDVLALSATPISAMGSVRSSSSLLTPLSPWSDASSAMPTPIEGRPSQLSASTKSSNSLASLTPGGSSTSRSPVIGTSTSSTSLSSFDKINDEEALISEKLTTLHIQESTTNTHISSSPSWPGGFVAQNDDSLKVSIDELPPPPPYSPVPTPNAPANAITVPTSNANLVLAQGPPARPDDKFEEPPPLTISSDDMYYSAYSLVDSYDSTRSVANLTEAITLLQEALINPSIDTDTQLYATQCLAWAYFKRHVALAGQEDLMDAVTIYRNTLEMCPKTHDLRGCVLHDLGYALAALYEVHAEKPVIKEAVMHLNNSLKLCKSGDMARAQRLDTLSRALLKLIGEHPTYLHEVFGRQRESLALLKQTDDPQYDELKIVCGKRVLDLHEKWAEQRAHTAFLGGLKPCFKDAFALLPSQHLDRWKVVLDFGRLVGRQYGIDNLPLSVHPTPIELFTQGSRMSWKLVPSRGPPELLADMFWFSRAFLELVPQGHVERWRALSLLSVAADWQWRLTKDKASLREAVDLHRQALALSPRNTPDRALSVQATKNLMHQAAAVFSQPWLLREAQQVS